MTFGTTTATTMDALRKGMVGRVASWLCIAVFVTILALPVSPALADDHPVLDAIAASICQVVPDGDEAVPGQGFFGSYCPMCLAGGALWLPPSRLPEPIRLEPAAAPAIPVIHQQIPESAPGVLRPATRAPPVFG